MHPITKGLAELASKDNSSGYPVTLEYSKWFAERLTKLVIQECAQIIHVNTDDSIRVVMAIETHFGLD